MAFFFFLQGKGGMYSESHVCLHDPQIPVHRDTFFQCERNILSSTMVTKETIKVHSVVKPVCVVSGRGWGLKQPLGVKSEAQGQRGALPRGLAAGQT